MKEQNKIEEKNSWVTQEIEEKGYYDTYEDFVYKEIFKATILKIGLPKGSHILDVGCASGAFSKRLVDLGFKVTGCDISLEAIKAPTKNIRKNCNFIACDIENSCFKDNLFDACFCADILHHFPDIQKLIFELKRITKPGGYIFTSDPNKLNPHNFLCQEKNSPVRYDKLTINERSIGPKELEKNFKNAVLEYDIYYLFCRLRRKGKGILKNKFLYKVIGFIVVSIKGFWKRILAFFLYNIAHAITPFLSHRRRANIIICIGKKAKQRNLKNLKNHLDLSTGRGFLFGRNRRLRKRMKIFLLKYFARVYFII